MPSTLVRLTCTSCGFRELDFDGEKFFRGESCVRCFEPPFPLVGDLGAFLVGVGCFFLAMLVFWKVEVLVSMFQIENYDQLYPWRGLRRAGVHWKSE